MPTLLTRRDELFPLARQVVRESGYQYSKGHSRSQFSQTGFPSKLFGTNVNIAGTPGTPPGANGEREHPSPLAGTVGKIEGKQPRKRQRISDNDFLQQKRRVRLNFTRLGVTVRKIFLNKEFLSTKKNETATKTGLPRRFQRHTTTYVGFGRAQPHIGCGVSSESS